MTTAEKFTYASTGVAWLGAIAAGYKRNLDAASAHESFLIKGFGFDDVTLLCFFSACLLTIASVWLEKSDGESNTHP